MIRDIDINLMQALELHCKNTPDKIAYRFLHGMNSVETLTYNQLYDLAILVAGNFKSLGAKTDDRVLIVLPQNLQYLLTFFGGIFARVILIPSLPPRKQSESNNLASIIKDTSASFVVGLPENLEHIKNLTRMSKQCSEINFIDINDLTRSTDKNHHNFLPREVSKSQIAFLQYTSGSTGMPKGVIVDHGNLIANFEMMHKGLRVNRDSIIVSWLPFYHDMGLIGGALLPIYYNAQVVLMTPFQFVKRPLFWLEAITHWRGTHAYAPNFAYDLCINAAQKGNLSSLDLSSWIIALNGAEPIRAATIKNFISTFEQYGFNPASYYPSYGLAEATLYVTGGELSKGCQYKIVDENELASGLAVKPSRNSNGHEIVSCGKAWGDEQILIVDPNSFNEQKINHVGEIWLMGSNITRGYWNRPEINKKTFSVFTGNSAKGPCLRTGDLGYLDEDGNLYVVSRLKDMIVIRGKNYAPQDIESTSEEVSQLKQSNFVAAFSLDINNLEELIIVVEVKNLKMDEIQIISKNIKNKLSLEYSLIPFDIVFVDRGGIPRTTSGKIKRALCKSNYVAKQLPIYNCLS